MRHLRHQRPPALTAGQGTHFSKRASLIDCSDHLVYIFFDCSETHGSFAVYEASL
jgi:hypothetical protein